MPIMIFGVAMERVEDNFHKTRNFGTNAYPYRAVGIAISLFLLCAARLILGRGGGRPRVSSSSRLGQNRVVLRVPRCT